MSPILQEIDLGMTENEVNDITKTLNGNGKTQMGLFVVYVEDTENEQPKFEPDSEE